MDTMRVEIHFHQLDEASVFFESSVTEEDQQQRDEIIFFSLFTARQLTNVGNDMQAASSLAKALSTFELPWAPERDDLKAFTAFILSGGPDTPELVDYNGSPGRKIFEAELRMGPSLSFTLRGKNFGLVDRGYSYYALRSVLLLLRYLARRRMQEGKACPDYLYNLAKVAEFCGKLYLNGKLSVENHVSEALDLVSIAQKETLLYGPSWVDSPVYGSDRIGYLAFSSVPEAIYEVGCRYHKGEVYPQDDKAAADHFRKAAEKGFLPAKYMLGCMYLDGDGVEKSEAEGFKWITEAALEGYVDAQVVLGKMYESGIGLSQNLKEATKWYNMAAKGGNEEAQMLLSHMGSSGK
jgi:TPR repeat protein